MLYGNGVSKIHWGIVCPPTRPSSLLSSRMLCLSQWENWTRKAFLVKRMTPCRCRLPCVVALLSGLGFEGRKGQAPVLSRHVECHHFIPERVRHLSPKYFSYKLFLHSLSLVISQLHSSDKQCRLPLVSEMCFPLLKHWFLSLCFGLFLKVKGTRTRDIFIVGPNNRQTCMFVARQIF